MSVVEDVESASRSAILDAAKQVANREALEEANKEAAATLRNERNSIFEVSEHELFSIKERLFNEIKDISESVEINYNGALVFGNAGLVFGEQIDTFQQVDTILSIRGNKALSSCDWDVLNWSMISLTCEDNSKRKVYSWSASLLFADRKDGNGFRWYEVAFWRLNGASIDELSRSHIVGQFGGKVKVYSCC